MDRGTAFDESRNSVTAIEEFTQAFPGKDRVAIYLSLAEVTDDSEVEAARERLRIGLICVNSSPSEQNQRELGYAWEKFLRVYGEYYTEVHSKLASSNDFRQFAISALGEGGYRKLCDAMSITAERGDVQISIRRIRRRLASFRCNIDPLPYLSTSPSCVCGFQPSMSGTIDALSAELVGIASYIDAPIFISADTSTEHLLNLG
jgi:hypothetical protein